MIHYLRLADWVTLTGLGASALAIVLVLLPADPQFITAAILLLVAVVADAGDGWIASRDRRYKSPYGRYLDSLADLAGFGVATSVLMLVRFPHWAVGISAVLLILAGAVRLARFQLLAERAPGRTSFEGVPITVAGVILPVLAFFAAVPAVLVAIIMLVLAALMIAPIHVRRLF